jgi:hypothetical protein
MAPLDFDRAAHRIDHAAKLDDAPVAAPAVDGDDRIAMRSLRSALKRARIRSSSAGSRRTGCIRRHRQPGSLRFPGFARGAALGCHQTSINPSPPRLPRMKQDQTVDPLGASSLLQDRGWIARFPLCSVPLGLDGCLLGGGLLPFLGDCWRSGVRPIEGILVCSTIVRPRSLSARSRLVLLTGGVHQIADVGGTRRAAPRAGVPLPTADARPLESLSILRGSIEPLLASSAAPPTGARRALY